MIGQETVNLSFDGVFKTPSFSRKSNKIMHCVDLFFRVVVLRMWAFFTYFDFVSMEGGGLYLSITDKR